MLIIYPVLVMILLLQQGVSIWVIYALYTLAGLAISVAFLLPWRCPLLNYL